MYDSQTSLHDDAPAPEPAKITQDAESRDASERERQRSQLNPGSGPFFVLVNVSSGSGGAHRADAVRQNLRDAGLEAHLFPIDQPERVEELLARAADLARDSGGTVVIAGGDGTINTSLPLLLEDDIPLGILPSGTFNYVAREFGIPLNLKDAVHTLATGSFKEIPVGQVNGRPFLVNASLGLYPRLLEDREQAKRKYGRNRALALLSSASSLIARRDRTFRLEVQRQSEERPLGAPHELDISTLFIGNNTLQLRNLGIEPQPSELVAIVLRKPSPLRLIELGLRAAVGTLGDAKDILTFPFEKLVAEARQEKRKGIKIALDGEVMRMDGPLVFHRASRPLKLIVPHLSRSPEPT